MKILLTGSTGLLGSALCPALRDAGHHVRAMTRLTSSTDLVDMRDVQQIRGNVLEPESLLEAVRGQEVIIHAVASILDRDVEAVRRVNVDGTFHLLDAVRTHGHPDARFIYISSITAGGYGTSQTPLDERMKPRPATHYGRTKLEAEELVKEHGRNHRAVSLRLCTLYGPRDRFFPVLYRLIDLGLMPILGSGEMEMSLMHATDAVRAVMAAIDSPDAPDEPFYYVSGPEAASWSHFCESIQRGLGRRRSVPVKIPGLLLTRAEGLLDRARGLPRRLRARIPHALCPDLVRMVSGSGLVCDGGRFASDTGFEASVDLDAGLRETIRWFRDHDLL